ncbi:LOW QUALITY PROTEIN: BH3-like motif-containing cell death inducer [Microcebus murinus]|uniref:LOW QUALITY PROTEIN: BH3-like motif-containing cell death inducer n=1 Tax=Microcebus murinus TaxID=30608 RepID=UPI000642BD39|nr:LOW QUALITY PROTEIN: BH3-like motif-containing cell death inducer [Microcebus murinus]
MANNTPGLSGRDQTGSLIKQEEFGGSRLRFNYRGLQIVNLFQLDATEGQEISFYYILEAECMFYTAWLGRASGSSIFPEAKRWLQLETLLGSNEEPILPKETMFPLTRYSLGSSAVKRAVPGNVLQRPSYLSRMQIALLRNPPAEAL